MMFDTNKIPAGPAWLKIDEDTWIDISKFTGIKLLGTTLNCFNYNEVTEHRCDPDIARTNLEAAFSHPKDEDFTVIINNQEHRFAQREVLHLEIRMAAGFRGLSAQAVRINYINADCEPSFGLMHIRQSVPIKNGTIFEVRTHEEMNICAKN